MGILPDGTSVSTYYTLNGYGISLIPNWNMINLQTVFYNTVTNLDGFNNAMQEQRDKYEGKNILIQRFYSALSKNISIIS